MNLTTAQRAAVIAEAMTWLRTPYHHHGRVKGAGVDCLTFIHEVFKAVSLSPPVDPGYYSTQWHLHRSEELYLQGLAKLCDEVVEPLPADIVLFRYGRCFSHGAIVVQWPNVIHSLNPSGCQLADATQHPLAGRHTRFFSLRIP